MIETFKTYLKKHYDFSSLFEKSDVDDEKVGFNKYKLTFSKRIVLNGLRFSPIICGVGFGIAFSIKILGSLGWVPAISNFQEQNYAVIQALYIIFVSGLIGFGTNWLAIKMLFRPVMKRPIWGQGLIPAQRDRIIYTLAQGMHKHVLNQDLIRKRVEETGLVKKVNNLMMDGTTGLIQDEEMREQIKTLIFDSMTEYANRDDVRKQIREIIDDRLEKKLDGGVKVLLQVYKRYRKDTYEEVIDNIVAEIPKVVREVTEKLEKELDRLAAYIRKEKSFTETQIMNVFIDLLNRIDITALLAKQMAHFDEAKLERMVWEATNEQLLYIQYLGTILGILGGLLIWKPEITGPLYVVLFSVLYLIDNLLYRVQKNRNQLSDQN